MIESDELVRQFIGKLNEHIEDHDAVILAGRVPDFPEYQRLTGYRKGLVDAGMFLNEVIDKWLEENNKDAEGEDKEDEQ